MCTAILHIHTCIHVYVCVYECRAYICVSTCTIDLHSEYAQYSYMYVHVHNSSVSDQETRLLCLCRCVYISPLVCTYVLQVYVHTCVYTIHMNSLRGNPCQLLSKTTAV